MREALLMALWVLAPAAAGCRFSPFQNSALGGRERPPPGSPPAEAVRRPEPPAAQKLVEEAARALDLIDAGSLDEAARAADRLAAISPGEGTAEAMAALLRLRLARAADRVSRARAAPPQDAEAASRKHVEAAAFIQKGRDAQALEALEQAHALDSSSAKIADDLVALLKRLGLEAYGKGDAARAAAYWQRALEIHPGEPETVRFLERANAVNRKV